MPMITIDEFFLQRERKNRSRKVNTTTIKSTVEVEQFYINRKEAIFRPDYVLSPSLTKVGYNKKSYKITSKTFFNDYEGI